jgi:hypothetical protein
MSGWGKSCEYHQRAEKASPSSDAASPEKVQDPDNIIKLWDAQRRGATHWSELLSTVGIPFMESFKRTQLN